MNKRGVEAMKKIIFLTIIFLTFTPTVLASSTTLSNNLNSNFETILTANETETNSTYVDLDTSKGCESYLGNPTEPGDPAYYLQFVFDLMKYLAIILLFVLTAVEFGKATIASNQDAIKKAIQNTIKRFIIAVIIFFLPSLIEFLLTLMGVYSASTCGIS